MLLVSTSHRVGGSLSDKPSNPFHVREWTDQEFVGLISAYFESVALFGQRFVFAPRGFQGSRTVARAIATVIAPQLKRLESRDDPVKLSNSGVVPPPSNVHDRQAMPGSRAVPGTSPSGTGYRCSSKGGLLHLGPSRALYVEQRTTCR